MKRGLSARLAIAVLAFCLPLVPNLASAQQEKGKETAATEQKPRGAYRIEFNVREFEGEKRLNSRNYMMVVENDNRGMIRVGNRVPFQTGDKTYQYTDVGMDIDCRPRERENGVALFIAVGISNIVPEEPTAPTFNPVVRSQRIEVAPIVTLGKPTTVATMDDVNTNRRYEIEVTATKVK